MHRPAERLRRYAELAVVDELRHAGVADRGSGRTATDDRPEPRRAKVAGERIARARAPTVRVTSFPIAPTRRAEISSAAVSSRPSIERGVQSRAHLGSALRSTACLSIAATRRRSDNSSAMSATLNAGFEPRICPTGNHTPLLLTQQCPSGAVLDLPTDDLARNAVSLLKEVCRGGETGMLRDRTTCKVARQQ
jgi:hypothetical protein